MGNVHLSAGRSVCLHVMIYVYIYIDLYTTTYVSSYQIFLNSGPDALVGGSDFWQGRGRILAKEKQTYK